MNKEVIVTATQKKKEFSVMDFSESIEKIKSCDFIISISKTRLKKGESGKLEMGYNGKRLFPLIK